MLKEVLLILLLSVQFISERILSLNKREKQLPACLECLGSSLKRLFLLVCFFYNIK